VAAALLSLTGCDVGIGDFERFSHDFHYNYPLNPSGTLSLETFNGSIEVSTWDQNTVDISGTKYAPSQAEADSMDIRIDHTPDSVSIRAVRPTDRRGNRGAKFVVRVPRGVVLDRLISSNGSIEATQGAGPGRFKTSNAHVHVRDFHGKLDIETSNGGIELSDIDGDVQAHTSNSHIRAARVEGKLDATTSNGGIDAEMARADCTGKFETNNSNIELTLPPGYAAELRANTSNGSITLKAPAELNARVVARTSNSQIHSDFEMRTRGEFSKNRLEASMGSGAGLVDLSSSNGSIRLLRR
jgi:DUF4097 and DUF4098 domain-containing protein YvlB